MSDEIMPTPEGNEATPTPEGTPGETATPEKEEPPKEPEVDYKKKFSESTREAQRLARAKKELEEKYARWQTLEAKGLQPEDIETYLKTEGSDLNAVKTQRELEIVKREIALQKEETNLTRLITKLPEIEPLKETLRALGRAYPDKSLEELYDEHLNPAINFGQQRVYSKLEQKKASQVESGKGSGEGKTTLTPEDFAKLPLDKQQKYLKEQGL